MPSYSTDELINLKAAIISRYYSVLRKMVAAHSKKSRRTISPDQIYISEIALSDAIHEIIADFKIMRQRRKFFEHLSTGKLAGIIVFRLSRWTITSTSNPLLLKDKTFLKINFEVALHVGLCFISLSYTEIDKTIGAEILYTLMRRHVNQETLGLVFDTLRLNLKNQQSATSSVLQ